MEGEGSSDELMEIMAASDSLDASLIFHTVNDTMAFLLHMHQQIPSLLQDITMEFDTLCDTRKELELGLQNEQKVGCRRKHMSQMREVRQGIKRLDKLMKSVASCQMALKLIIREVPNLPKVALVLGASPLRPQCIYELCYLHKNVMVSDAEDFTKSKDVDRLSKKVIRTLISMDAGSVSYPGPSKLFLLVKAPSTFSLPLQFLPKRDFRFNKKVAPFRLQLKCKTQCQETHAPDNVIHDSNFGGLTDSSLDNLIWFQCRHVIKGLPTGTPHEE